MIQLVLYWVDHYNNGVDSLFVIGILGDIMEEIHLDHKEHGRENGNKETIQWKLQKEECVLHLSFLTNWE